MLRVHTDVFMKVLLLLYQLGNYYGRYSGWAEYKALRKASSRAVAKFIYEVWMARFGCPLLIVNDGGPENQALTKELFERFNVRNVQVAGYHPQSNGLVERGHQKIVDALAKLTAPSGKPGNWPPHLAAVSWADRITVRKSTGMTPYQVVFGQECLLPVEIAMESWPWWIGCAWREREIREWSCWRYAPGSWKGGQRTSRRRRRRSGRIENQIASIFTNIDATDPRERITNYAAETWFYYTIRNSIRHTHTSYLTGGLGRIGLPTLRRKEIGELLGLSKAKVG